MVLINFVNNAEISLDIRCTTQYDLREKQFEYDEYSYYDDFIGYVDGDLEGSFYVDSIFLFERRVPSVELDSDVFYPALYARLTNTLLKSADPSVQFTCFYYEDSETSWTYSPPSLFGRAEMDGWRSCEDCDFIEGSTLDLNFDEIDLKMICNFWQGSTRW